MIQLFTFNSNSLKSKPKHTGIVYFDGVCVMCNGLVNFLMDRDKNNTLQFASLQGETAKTNIDSKYLTNLSTVVYQEADNTYTELDAIIKILASLGGIWRIVLILKLIPNFIGNRLYRIVSTNRYKWFGKKEECRVPKQEEKDKILP